MSIDADSGIHFRELAERAHCDLDMTVGRERNELRFETLLPFARVVAGEVKHLGDRH